MNDLLLMSDKPITINQIDVYPLKVRDVLVIGEDKYHQLLQILLMEKNQFLDLIINEELKSFFENIPLYDLYLFFCQNDKSFHYLLSEAFKTFTGKGISVDDDFGIHIENNGKVIPVDQDTLISIREVIKKQNFLKNGEDNSYKPATNKAQELLERMKKAKEKIQKENKEDSLKLSDIVSIVSCYGNDINILTVWDLTIYQLYMVYLRLIIWDDYQTKQLMLPHVTDAKQLNLQHWSTSIDKKLKQ